MSVSFNDVVNKYSALSSCSSQTEYCNVEYIWIDGTSTKLLSKTQWLKPRCRGANDVFVKDIPKTIFNTDTQLTNWCCKNTGLLQPVHYGSTLYDMPPMYKDPFRRETQSERYRMTLCETFLSNNEPTTSTKNRMGCKSLMESKDVSELQCEFEIEQEFSFKEIPIITNIVEKDCVRKTLESFNRACTYAGLLANGFSIENHPKSFLSYKIGPCRGLRVSDELWMSRYILQRVAEEFHLTPNFGPMVKDYQVRFPHAIYSFTNYEMRFNLGRIEAENCIRKMKDNHMQDLRSYNGTCGISEADLWKRDTVREFSEVVAIPLLTLEDRRSCIVDHRPRGNSDPYVVTKTIVENVCL